MVYQLHKRFSIDQFKSLIESYLKKEIEVLYALSILEIKKADSLNLLKSIKKL